jgi:vacuolar-type H+-ATPase subunit E/Vma4
MKPDMIIASSGFMAAWESERTRQAFLAAGANWRRAKREARKALQRSWREAAVERLERLANPQFSGIDRTALSWWRNPWL